MSSHLASGILDLQKSCMSLKPTTHTLLLGQSENTDELTCGTSTINPMISG
ncbi:MAG: hypothetical protein IH840_14755 [Candidatus Heimdallarchaeota archaeon]|nr:hypothetical protein [Candidatus Heimdallarchaeota archaeon]